MSAEEDPAKRIARLERRVRWQHEKLDEVEQIRASDVARREQAEAELASVRQELFAARARLLAHDDPQPSSRRSRLAGKIHSRFASPEPQPRVGQDAPADPNDQLVEAIASSGLFDPQYYMDANDDVDAGDPGPLEHYLKVGGVEGRPASILFDSGRYLRDNPDVGAAGINPLAHYLLHGRQEGRLARTIEGALLVGDPRLLGDYVESGGLPTPDQFDNICASIRFKTDVDVDASIVISVDGNIDQAIACLESLYRLQTRRHFEIIAVNTSTDTTTTVLSSIDGLRYLEASPANNNSETTALDQAASIARGRYLVTLTSSTTVEPRWLDGLLDTFDQHDDVGVVGSRLVHGDGRLHQAGGIIYADGSLANYGNGDAADHPRYNYVRQVDFCSLASAAIDREYFDKLNGLAHHTASQFDEADFCMHVRNTGGRVMYQPASVAVYHRAASPAKATTGGRQDSIETRAMFKADWNNILEAEHLAGPLAELEAADRQPIGHVLIVDANIPKPDRDSGSIDMVNLIKIIGDLGYRVHFIPVHGSKHGGRYQQALEQIGAIVGTEPHYGSLSQYLNEHGDRFDAVVMARVTVAKDVVDEILELCPSAKTIFYTVDLHFLRLQRQAAREQDRQLLGQAQQLRTTELHLMNQVDTTVVLSSHEQQLLADLGYGQVQVIPLIRDVPENPVPGFTERDGVVFVGGFAHPPNVDAVNWLLEDIWPEVRRRQSDLGLPPITLRIIGGGLPPHLLGPEPDVEYYGYVENLDPIFDRSLLSLAPLRFGAGLKGKVATSLGRCVPVVASAVAGEGVPPTPAVTVVGESASGFAEAIVALTSDRNVWEHSSGAARPFAQQAYSLDTVRPLVDQMLSRSETSDMGGVANQLGVSG